MRRRLQTVSPAGSVEHELALRERRLRAELKAELDARMLELRGYVDAEFEAIDTRITHVHARALRELTRQTEARR